MPSYSSNANDRYFRTNWLQAITLEDPATVGAFTIELDPYSSELHDMITQIGEYQFHKCTQGEKLPTICFRYHGTTSTWWIVLFFNGLLSVDELQPGMIIRIPTQNALRNVLNVPINPVIARPSPIII